jgi:membrane protease YdiL (CAAX protease family)
LNRKQKVAALVVSGLPVRAPVLASLLLALVASRAAAQKEFPPPPQFDTVPAVSFHWPVVVARLWSDSAYTFRQAALQSYVDPAELPNHTVEYRDSVDTGSATVSLKIFVDRPLASAEIAQLLAFYIRQNPSTEIIAFVALRDTAGRATEAVESQILVSYMYLHYGQVDHEWGEFFCVGYRVADGLILDEGGPLSIPRCNDTIGGDPWPTTTPRETAIAYVGLFLQTGMSFGPLVPVLLIFVVLYAASFRKAAGDQLGRMESSKDAGKIALAFFLVATFVTAALTAAVYCSTPGPHPFALKFSILTSRHLKMAYQQAGLVTLLLVIVAPIRARSGLPAQAPPVRKVAGAVLVLALLSVPVYSWIGAYATPQDFIALTARETVRASIHDIRIDALATSATIDLLILGLSIVVIGPIAEEFFFRGLTLPILERHLGSIFAVTVSAVLFGLSHISINMPNAVSAFLLGLLCGTIFVRRRSLTWCVVAHATWNAIVFGAALLYALRS